MVGVSRERRVGFVGRLASGIPLVASDADGDALTLRVVAQPVHGTVGLVGTTATYFP